MKWKPKPGKVYPALFIKHKDESFGVELFPTEREREQELTRIINRQVRKCFPALPKFDCPLPVRAKIIGTGRLAVELLTPDGVEWHEMPTAPKRPKRRRKATQQTIEIAVPIETDVYGEESLAKIFADNPDRVQILPDGTQQITLKPGEIEMSSQLPPQGKQP